MTTIQTTAIATALAAAIGTGAYQGHQAAKARNEAENLRQQQAPLAEQIKTMQRERDDATNRLTLALNEVASARKDSSELLRLRGEVTRLRAKTKALEADVKAGEKFESVATASTSNTPPVKIFQSSCKARIAWNEPVVVGGWKSPDGKRALVIAQPSQGNDSDESINIKAFIVECTEEAAVTYGLTQFIQDEGGVTKPTTLNRNLFETLTERGGSGIDLYNEASITTLSGRQTQIQCNAGVQKSLSGEDIPLGPTVDILPKIAEGGKSLDMDIVTSVTYPAQPPKAPERNPISQ